MVTQSHPCCNSITGCMAPVRLLHCVHRHYGCLSRWIVTTDLPSEADRGMDLKTSDLHAPDLLSRCTHALGWTPRWFAADNQSVGAERRHPTLVCSREQKLQQHTGVDTGLSRSTFERNWMTTDILYGGTGITPGFFCCYRTYRQYLVDLCQCSC